MNNKVMASIFENAHFGKAYKTRNGKKALYIGVDDYSPIHLLFVDDWLNLYDYNSEGFALDTDSNPMPKCDLNIVSEWQDKINEEDLERLAEQSNPYPSFDKSDMCVAHSHDGFNEGFIEGYRLASKQ